jgi:hypothetical protein
VRDPAARAQLVVPFTKSADGAALAAKFDVVLAAA